MRRARAAGDRPALLGGLAAASRNSGIVLIVPLVAAVPLRPAGGSRLGPDAACAPSGASRALLPRYPIRAVDRMDRARARRARVAYIGWLALKYGDGLAPFHAQQVWFRHFAGPFGGVWDGAVAAWDGLRQLVHGPPPPIYFTKAGGERARRSPGRT